MKKVYRLGTSIQIKGNYYQYEKDMQKAIEMGLEKKQSPLVRELTTEQGNYFL